MRLVGSEEMRAIERIAIEEMGISGTTLMERAGRATAECAITLAGQAGTDRGGLWRRQQRGRRVRGGTAPPPGRKGNGGHRARGARTRHGRRRGPPGSRPRRRVSRWVGSPRFRDSRRAPGTWWWTRSSAPAFWRPALGILRRGHRGHRRPAGAGGAGAGGGRSVGHLGRHRAPDRAGRSRRPDGDLRVREDWVGAAARGGDGRGGVGGEHRHSGRRRRPDAPTAELLDESAVRALVPPRGREAHKGDAGRLLVVAGSSGRTGAAHLALTGALRGGVGLVTLASRAEVVGAALSGTPRGDEPGPAGSGRHRPQRHSGAGGGDGWRERARVRPWHPPGTRDGASHPRAARPAAAPHRHRRRRPQRARRPPGSGGRDRSRRAHRRSRRTRERWRVWSERPSRTCRRTGLEWRAERPRSGAPSSC